MRPFSFRARTSGPKVAKGVGLLTTVLVTLSIAVLIMPPIVEASITPVAAFKAPYYATVSRFGPTWHVLRGCAASIRGSPGNFNSTSGDFTARINVSVAPINGCTGGTAYERHGVGIKTLSFSVPRTRAYNISCEWSARIQFALFSNQTNNTGFGHSTSRILVFAYCNHAQKQMFGKYMTLAGSRSSVVQNKTVYANYSATLTAGVTYYIATWLHYDVFATAGGQPNTLVSAFLAINHPANSDSLVKIVVW